MKRVKKGAALFIFGIIISILIISYIQTVLAYDTEDIAIPKAYSWLVNHTKNKWDTLTIRQDAFSLLALGCNSTYSKQGNRSLMNLSYYSSNSSAGKIRCWRESGKATLPSQCKLTETSLVKMALNELGGNTTYVDNWLLSNKRVFTSGIYWFLQIDIARGKEASCEVMYLNKMQNVSIHADKTVSILTQDTPNNCIESVFRGYWFKIKQSEECYGNSYLIKCFGNESTAEPVVSTLLYRNNTNDPRTTFFVSSEISQGTLGFVNQIGEEEQNPGIMELNTPSYCLGNPSDPQGTCDYEGTAWATFVWNREGNEKNVNMFLPYLIVYSSFNEKYFPETFLSKFIGGEYTERVLKEEQRIKKPQSQDYWSFWLNQPLLYGEFYDTPLAVLSLGDSAPHVSENKEYLLGHIAKDYSWINIFDAAPNDDTHRDTAFVLWVFWPNYCPGFQENQPDDCLSQGLFYECKEMCDSNQIQWSMFSCPDYLTCCSNITGENQDECIARGGECVDGTTCSEGYGQFNDVTSCPDSRACCKNFAASYCSDWNGNFCDFGYSCPSGESVETLDGTCCLSQCIQGGGTESCSDLFGTVCQAGEICWDFSLSKQIDLIPSLDENCCPATCVKDSSCDNVGEDCQEMGSEYQCVDSSGGYGNTVATKDNEECCLDDCKKGCTTSQICTLDQECLNNQWDTGSIESRCCLSECKNKSGGGSWIWIIIVIVILVLGVLAYFFLFKKKKSNEEIDEFTGLPKEDSKKRKDDFDMNAFNDFNQEKGKNQMPVFRKPVEKPVSVKPVNSKPVKEVKKEAGKTKAEQELEDTLGKLKSLTKKK